MLAGNLRKAVLQAAIQGKLTKQHDSDGDVDELIEAINMERERLIKEKVIKKYKAFEPITEEEIPFDIPDSWRWMRLGDIITFSSEKKIEGEKLPLLNMNYFRQNSNTTYVDKGIKVSPNDLLILKDGENSGEVFRVPQYGYIGSTLKKFIISEYAYEDFILYFLDFKFEFLKENKIGSAIPHLNFNLFNNLLLPLPPLEEQKRIVEKLEQLLPLCDELI